MAATPPDDTAWGLQSWRAALSVTGPGGSRPAAADPRRAGLKILTRGTEGEEARALCRGPARHPGDFWINLHLGYILLAESPDEAVGYFRAAVASRPESSQAQIMVGRHYTTPATRTGPSLSSGRPSHSLPISPSPGTWPGRWPQGAGWKRHVPSGQKGWKRFPRLTTSGTATPRFRIPRQRGSIPLGPQGPPRTPQRQHRPLGHRRARRLGLPAPAN